MLEERLESRTIARNRRPWTEGPDEEAPPESWLLLDDDALLHRIETTDPGENEDERLLEVVESDRHFFIRQEAAKRVQDRNRLFDFEDDRHVGQILVRHLTRREDVTYLERLSARSKHVEVRSAAQVQLARLWRRLDAKEPAPAGPKAPAAVASARRSRSGAGSASRAGGSGPARAGDERPDRAGRRRRQPAGVGRALPRRALLVAPRHQGHARAADADAARAARAPSDARATSRSRRTRTWPPTSTAARGCPATA